MAQVEVRRLTQYDYEAMTRLWKRAGLPYKPKGRDSKTVIAQQMEAYPEFFLGAFDEERLVGVVVGSYETRFKGWINRLAVDPEYQGRGIAQQLVKKAEEALEKHGAKIFCALIETPNKESENLFRKMGYNAHKEVLYVTKRENEDV
jgi:ribosomal protein S18 acetylase RimI-like enzyme